MMTLFKHSLPISGWPWGRGRSGALGPSERRLLHEFDRGRMPAGGFGHREHVQVAWTYLSLHSPARAIERFVAALRRFARAQGKPELYHETVTWAFLLLIRERMARGEPGEGFEAFAARNLDLFARSPSILSNYYAPSTLESALARRTFLLPDRGPRCRDR